MYPISAVPFTTVDEISLELCIALSISAERPLMSCELPRIRWVTSEICDVACTISRLPPESSDIAPAMITSASANSWTSSRMLAKLLRLVSERASASRIFPVTLLREIPTAAAFSEVLSASLRISSATTANPLAAGYAVKPVALPKRSHAEFPASH